MPYTSVPVVELVENTKEPVADWLPIVLLLTVKGPPDVIIIPAKGEDVVVPLEVTPVILTAAIVLDETVLAVPPVITLIKIATNLPVDPVRV
jgi:hypothetical protein